jgi:cytochrome c oxidase subunit 4
MSDAPSAAPAAAAEHAPGHGEEPHVNYMAKFWWLLGLTVTEVAVAIWIPGGFKLVLLAILSCWKAAIVLRYFMHLKSERLPLKLLIAFPFALILILVLLFLTDAHWLGYSSY